MTQPNPAQPVVEPPPVQVSAEKGSRLEQLHAAYADAKAAADDAAAKLKAITDALKVELAAHSGNGEKVDLVTAGHRPLRLAYQTSWRLDSTRLKAEDPATYVRYAKQSGVWVLKAVGGGS